MICIVGASGSGKNTLADAFVKCGFTKLVSYTTRPKREGEVEGYDYHFINNYEFDDMEDEGLFIDISEFYAFMGGTEKQLCRYGITKNSCGENVVAVLTPSGVSSLKEKYDGSILVIMMNTDEEIRLSRLVKRGDDMKEVMRRGREYDDFDDWDIRVTNNTDSNLENMASTIADFFKLKDGIDIKIGYEKVEE